MTEHTDLTRGVEAITAGVPDELGPLRENLRHLLTILHWYHLDGWVDELLVEVRAGWSPTTKASQTTSPPFMSILRVRSWQTDQE